MKSNRTMLSLARALAYSKEVQELCITDDVTVIGYALKMTDLFTLYKGHGFTSADVPRRHVLLWKELGLVKTYFNDQVVVFVPEPSDFAEIYELTMVQKQYGASAIAILPPKEAKA